jgi:uncharacterized zinc-type alcohol dehydrogenase-like protein
MCSGVTLYAPLKRYAAGPGTRVCIVGVGGLGQMGIAIARALGCSVTAVSRGEDKRALATQLGAAAYIASGSAEQMAASRGSQDLVLNTIPFEHDYAVYTQLTTARGVHVMLGLHNSFAAAMLVDGITCGASRVKMSSIGSIADTQAVVDLCAEHEIHPSVQIVSASEVNAVYEDLDGGNKSGLRFVIDIASLRAADVEERCVAAPPPKFSTHAGGISYGGLLAAAAKMLFTFKWM